jgi:crotonobetainyl-CoA:carnitine CoA-transferase CaiB-like acyl-CoA transferase
MAWGRAGPQRERAGAGTIVAEEGGILGSVGEVPDS